MRQIILFIPMIISFSAFGQNQVPKNSYNDSMLTVLLKGVPKTKQGDFKKMYAEMTDDQKRLYEAMALPISSKKDLIANIKTSYTKIEELKILFNNLVSPGLTLYIEFKPPDKILNLGESIDYRYSMFDKFSNSNQALQEWNVELTSPKLDTFLKKIIWDRTKLNKIKIALKQANCISIENEQPVEIGFARSGMGKYYYLFFDHKLTADEVKKYNDKCDYIYYRDNIVLKYGGGAIGSQCFPYED